MYQNIWCEKRASNQVEVHLWDDKAGYQNFIFKNYAYVKDGAGQYQSIYGDKLKKVGYWTEEDFKTGRVYLKITVSYIMTSRLRLPMVFLNQLKLRIKLHP